MAPQTKARFAQSIQEELRAMSGIVAGEVSARAGAAWKHIEEALPVEWLDEPTYNALTESARVVLGEDAFRAFFRAHARRLVRSPSFQTTIEALIRVCGLSPHTLLKFAPRGRESVVRDSGVLTYERAGERCVRLWLRDFPVSTYHTGTTTLLLSGTWLGLVDLAGARRTANVELEDMDLARGRTCFVVSW